MDSSVGASFKIAWGGNSIGAVPVMYNDKS